VRRPDEGRARDRDVVPTLVPTFGLPAAGAKLVITGASTTVKLDFEVPSPLSLTTVIGRWWRRSARSPSAT
jgi:hypothetical protein